MTEASWLFWKQDIIIVKRNNQQCWFDKVYLGYPTLQISFLNSTVQKLLPILKNKFIITFGTFFLYLIFLDDNDIFYVVNQKKKLNELELQNEEVKAKLQRTKSDLDKISHLDNLEAYARERKFFKRDDEDIFVITNDWLGYSTPIILHHENKS